MDVQDFQQYFETRQSRRRVLPQLGVLASVGLALDACSSTASTHKSLTPVPFGPGTLPFSTNYR
jgi:hypothetical protein